jgi:hypothetical protein
MENVPTPGNEDVVLDASNHYLASHGHESVLSFDYPSTESNTSVWSDSSYTTPMSMSSFGDNTFNEGSAYPSQDAGMELSGSSGQYHELHTTTTRSNDLIGISSDQLDCLLIQNPPAAEDLLFHDPAQHLWPDGNLSGEAPNSNEDPFMGWDNKRASKALDDYGWVVSHVQSL